MAMDGGPVDASSTVTYCQSGSGSRRWRPAPKAGWRESPDPAEAGGLLCCRGLDVRGISGRTGAAGVGPGDVAGWLAIPDDYAGGGQGLDLLAIERQPLGEDLFTVLPQPRRNIVSWPRRVGQAQRTPERPPVPLRGRVVLKDTTVDDLGIRNYVLQRHYRGTGNPSPVKGGNHVSG